MKLKVVNFDDDSLCQTCGVNLAGESKYCPFIKDCICDCCEDCALDCFNSFDFKTGC